MSTEEENSNDITGLMKVPLHSIGTTESVHKYQSDNLMKTSLSSLMSTEKRNSNDITGLKKVPLHSIGTTESVHKYHSDNLMKTSLSSLMSTEKRNSSDIASLMKVPLHSIDTTESVQKCQSDNLVKTSLSSLMSTEKRNSSNIAGLMKVPLHSIGTTESVPKYQSDNLMKTSLSSLMSTEKRNSSDIASLMKVPLHSIGTTDSIGKCQSDNLVKTSLSSLMSTEKKNSSDIASLMKVPLHSIGTTESIHKYQSDNLMKTSLTSLVPMRPMENNNSNTVVESPVKTVAESPSSNSNLRAISTAVTSLPFSIINKSARNGDRVSARDLVEMNLMLATSPANTGPFFTAAKRSALSDLTVKSSECSSSPTLTASLKELAESDKALRGYSSVDVTEKARQEDTLSIPNGRKSKLTFPTEDVPGMIRKKAVSGLVTPLMNGMGQASNHDGPYVASIKEVRSSLKELSLESSVKGFLGKTAGLAVSGINSRLNENGRDVKSSRKTLENSLNKYNKHYDDTFTSRHMDGGLESDVTILTNRPARVERTTATVGKRVLKRKPSSFGRALSSLHEPDAKISRRSLIYDDGNGFSLPVRMDLRGLLHTGDGLGLRVFTFSTPSRDDVVVKKQKKAFQTKKERSCILDSAKTNSSSVPPIRECYRTEIAKVRVC